MKKRIEESKYEGLSPAMVRAMAARDRRVVVCAFVVVILLHVVLMIAARSVVSSPWSVAVGVREPFAKMKVDGRMAAQQDRRDTCSAAVR